MAARVLRLAKPMMGAKAFRKENRWWRDQARLVSELRDAGARVTLGSDSHTVIDMFAEARGLAMHERLASGTRQGWSAGQLWTAATSQGAASLGFDGLGGFEPGFFGVGVFHELHGQHGSEAADVAHEARVGRLDGQQAPVQTLADGRRPRQDRGARPPPRCAADRATGLWRRSWAASTSARRNGNRGPTTARSRASASANPSSASGRTSRPTRPSCASNPARRTASCWPRASTLSLIHLSEPTRPY